MSSIIEVVALALQRKKDNKYMIARRGPEESGAGFWEFPGGKLELGESQPEALVREISEEFSFQLEMKSLRYVDQSTYEYGGRKIRIYLWACALDVIPDFVLIDHDETTWCDPSEMRTYKISPGDVYFIDKLV